MIIWQKKNIVKSLYFLYEGGKEIFIIDCFGVMSHYVDCKINDLCVSSIHSFNI